MKRTKTIAAVLILGVAVFYATAARDGHNWKGDFSQYVMHARNLVQGLPYTDLGVLFYDGIGHKGTPPGYPLAMVPIIALFGLNFILLKWQIALFFALALWIYYRFTKDQLPAQWTLATLAFLAFTPWLLKFSNNLLSDIPFFAMSLLSVWAAHRFFSAPPRLSGSVALVLSLILAATFRSVGIILIGSALFYAVLFRRQHLRHTAVIVAIAYISISLINRFFEAGGSYATQFSLDPAVIASSIWQNLMGLERHWTRLLALYPARNEDSFLYLLINTPLLVLYLLLMGTGCYRSLRKRGIAIYDIYSVGILAVLLIYPYPIRPRYLLPILPFTHFYAMVGLRSALALFYQKKTTLRTRLRSRYIKALPTAIWAPLFLAYWGHYAIRPTTPEANILQDADVTTLFHEIEAQQSDISRVLFWRPRILRLFTGVQTASIYNLNEYPWTPDEIRRLVDQGISHLALDPNNPALTKFVSEHPALFKSCYRNDKFELLRIIPNHSIANAP